MLDEIGINMNMEMASAPGRKAQVEQPTAAKPMAAAMGANGGGGGGGGDEGGGGLDDDLQARLDALRKD